MGPYHDLSPDSLVEDHPTSDTSLLSRPSGKFVREATEIDQIACRDNKYLEVDTSHTLNHIPNNSD